MRAAVIRGLEWLTGRRQMERHYAATQDVSPGAFWAAALDRLDVTLDVTPAPSTVFPETGAAIVVANHPLGILDGLVLCRLVSQVRPDFHILVNRVLCRGDRIGHHFLPIDFSGSRAAQRQNVRSIKRAFDCLHAGSVLVVFPAGGVATASRPFGPVVELPWKPLLGRLVRKRKVPVVPVYVDGHNSRLFQLASQVSLTLRLSLLLHETLRKTGERLTVRLGHPIPYDALAPLGDRQALARYLRTVTLGLAAEKDGS